MDQREGGRERGVCRPARGQQCTGIPQESPLIQSTAGAAGVSLRLMSTACPAWTYQVRPVRVSHKCGGFKTKHEHKFGWKLDIPTITFWPADWRWCEDCRGRGSNNRVTVDLLTSVLSTACSLLSPVLIVSHISLLVMSPQHHRL